MYLSEDEEAEMNEMIEEAKKQVIEWYNSGTPRKFIESSLWSASLQHGEGSGYLVKTIILEGGEPKGTILVNYFTKTVIAFNKNYNKIRTWKGMLN